MHALLRKLHEEDDGALTSEQALRVVLILLGAAIAYRLGSISSAWWSEQTPWFLFFLKGGILSGLSTAGCIAWAYAQSTRRTKESFELFFLKNELALTVLKVSVSLLAICLLGMLVASKLEAEPAKRVWEFLNAISR